MPKGKQTCKILKEIRKQIAEENNIELVVAECTYQGDCAGTCPRCEAEVRYLEHELERRQRLGKAVMISGLAVTSMLGTTSCDSIGHNHVVGIVPDNLEGDPIEYQLEGDVAAPVNLDTLDVDTLKFEDELEHPLPGEPVWNPDDN